jgi:sugar fermentation stimulation protein A
MDFPSPLVRGRLIQRYKRFLADVVLDDSGEAITAHVPNPGAMLGLNTPGLDVWLSRSADPKRKLPYTLEMVEADGGLVGVNTMHPNRLAAEAIREGRIPELAGYESVRPEVKYGANSRVDFLLTGPGKPTCWLEIKNCHLRRAGTLAEFPDCVAARSAKHLRELEAVVAAGDRAVVLFTVQRTDCDAFAACHDLDPVFAKALDHAAEAGVEVLVYACHMTAEGIRLDRRIPWTGTPPVPDRTIHAKTPESAAMVAAVKRSMAITARMNRLTMDDAEEVRALLAELIGGPVDESVLLAPPFYAVGGGETRFGRRVFVNQNCTFYDLGGLTIGDDVMIGPNVSLITAGHPLDPATRRRVTIGRPIVIERNVWIAAGAIVIGGVTVGEDSVVAAGSVVTRDVPPGVLVAGNPARVVRSLEPG